MLSGLLAITVGLVLVDGGVNLLEVALALVESRTSASRRFAIDEDRAHVVNVASMPKEVLEELVGVLLVDNSLSSPDHV